MLAAQPPISISALAAMVQAIQTTGRTAATPPLPPVPTAWAPIARRTVHEWFADAPPQTLMIDLAARAAQSSAGAVFWIGRVCWPYVPALASNGAADTLLSHSVFVDVPMHQRAARVWAIDLVLRSAATAAVIADGRDLDIAQSRRLQLAAEAGGALAMLWRKPQEIRTLSVAHYRWRVTPAPTPGKHPRWQVEQLRCKDAAARRAGWSHKNTYMVEYRRAEGLVTVPADVVDRSRAPQTSASQRTA